MAHTAPQRFHRFGPNVLDCLRGVLWQDGVQVTLTPRVLDILSTLVLHHGELVTKDDFMKYVWGGNAVEDNNLARQISTLRKLLHERPGQRDYIATVPGVGYRFVGTVTSLDELPDDLLPLVGHSPAPVALEPATPIVAPVPLELPVAAAELPASPAAIPLPTPPPTRGTWFNRSLILGLGAAVAALLAATWPPSRTDAAPVSRALWQFTHGSGSQSDPAWSPDGARLALTSDSQGNSDIWVHDIGDSQATQLTSSLAHDWQPAWSPDGERLVFRSERDGGGLYIVRAGGGGERRLTTFGSTPRWSPDGRSILFSHSAPDSVRAIKLYVIDAAGDTPSLITHPALSGMQITSAAWTPDGRVSAWTRGDGNSRHFVTWSLAGGAATHSALPPTFAAPGDAPVFTAFEWAPSGRFLYFEGRTQAVRNLWRVAVEPGTLNWIGSPERLTVGPGADIGLSISGDGSKLAFGVNTARPGVWAFDFDPATGRIASTGERVVSGDSGERGADASSDGSRIVYRFERSDREEIWERPSNGPARLLVSDVGWTQSPPRWAPDSTRLAYQRSRTTPGTTVTHRAVAVLNVNTGGKPSESLVELGASEELVPMDWAADGRTILAACRLAPEETIGTCTLEAQGPSFATKARVITRLASDPRTNLFQQRYSPNQRWISFVAVPEGDRSATTLYVMPATGGPWRAVTDGASYEDKARWSPDGRVLYYISNRDGRFEVWGRRFDPGAGQPEGDAFRVTALEGTRQVLSPYLADMEMFITPNRIFLPMYEASSRVWVLDQVDR